MLKVDLTASSQASFYCFIHASSGDITNISFYAQPPDI